MTFEQALERRANDELYECSFSDIHPILPTHTGLRGLERCYVVVFQPQDEFPGFGWTNYFLKRAQSLDSILDYTAKIKSADYNPWAALARDCKDSDLWIPMTWNDLCSLNVRSWADIPHLRDW